MKLFNKKGVAIKGIIQFVYKVVYAAFVLASVVFLIKLLVFTSVPTQEVEIHGLANTIMNSPTIMYTDPNTGRLYPGIVDLEKFKSGAFESVVIQQKKTMAAELVLYFGNPNQFTSPIYYNEPLYIQLKPFIVADIEGSSGATFWKYQYPVQYLQDGIFSDGTLIVTVVRQND